MIFDPIRGPKNIAGIVPTIFAQFEIILTEVFTDGLVEPHSEQNALTNRFFHVGLPIEKVVRAACFC